jgi:hypothetical protein
MEHVSGGKRKNRAGRIVPNSRPVDRERRERHNWP